MAILNKSIILDLILIIINGRKEKFLYTRTRVNDKDYIDRIQNSF